MTEPNAPRVSRTWLEHRGNPEFLAVPSPRISWQVESDADGWTQRAVRLDLRRDGREAEEVLLDGRRSQLVEWPFPPLDPYGSARLRVSVQGADGVWSEPSAELTVRTGPLAFENWPARFLASPTPEENSRRSTRFRTVIDVPEGVVEATLSATAHGAYEAVLNGSVVGDVVLTPGWTAYQARLLVQTFDVIDLLRPGRNVLGATVGEGWYRERFGFNGYFEVTYDGPVALAAELRLRFADGSVQIFVTDGSWTSGDAGPVVASSIYDGETYDARREDDALTDPDADFPDAHPVRVLDVDPGKLRPASGPPVRRLETRAVQDVIVTPSGKTVLDFGQNVVGWAEIDVPANGGAEVTLRFAEVLEDGEVAMRPLRNAKATDVYIATGRPASWSPRFTFHGFRYVEVSGWPGELEPAAVRAIVVGSDLELIGDLTTSDPRLNRLVENVRWSMRGNFLSVPMDCPQRDERLGWTGDLQIFAPTAAFLADTTSFLGSWLEDLAVDQHDDGNVPMVIPDSVMVVSPPAAAWADAAVLVPETLYRASGDRGLLERQYPSMRKWTELEIRLLGDDLLWTGGFQWGDWLDPTAPPENPGEAKTDSDILATAWAFRSLNAMANVAGILGEAEDAARYADLAERVRGAFVAAYVTPSGRMVSDTQSAYSVAIAFGLITDPEQRRFAGNRLTDLVRAGQFHIRTGFMGTPYVCEALTVTGHLDVAYRLLLQDTLPSWLYPISMGATTTWERWDSMLPDGRVNPGSMTSFNHYALGAILDWMRRAIGGIAAGEPGYAVSDIAPLPGGGLTSARASFESGYGTIESEWRIQGNRLVLDVAVPPNAEARVTLPGQAAIAVGSGRHRFEAPYAEPEVREPAPLSLESPLADFADDPEAVSALRAAIRAVSYIDPAGWTSGGKWRPDSRLIDMLNMFPLEHVPAVQAAIDEVNARRGFSPTGP
ncbi:family 78 glycoside hydrolase catalytic domain [Lysobacter korlensis]|uniref:alpha-L-rhamnosidase n=1 Tax=Lysobacter korlensis TaxID=553636 RepID=A0ABV6RPN5_9GAMM